MPATSAILGEAVEAFGFLRLEVAVGGPIDDLAADLHAEPRGIEACEPADAALALADSPPQVLDLAAQGGNHPQARDDHSPFHGD